MSTRTVGVLRETKEGERRAPLVPSDIRWLVDRGIRIEVESSPSRAFGDDEYRSSGATVVDRATGAEILMTACPFCELNMGQAAREGIDGSADTASCGGKFEGKVIDLLELLEELIE